MQITEFVETANKATTAKELVTVWQKAMAAAGFDRVLFSLLTDHDTIGRRVGVVVAVNFSEAWLAKYFVAGFEPMRQQMFVTEGAFGWEKLRADARVKALKTSLFDEGPATGLYNGIGIPLRGSMGVFAGITAAGVVPGLALNEDTLDHVRMLSQQFYKAFLKLEAKPGSGEVISLTEKEREVLTWYSRGKSQPEIAIIMGITPHAVKFHLKSIFAKLNVQNDRVAVLKAKDLGLIFPDYDSQKKVVE